MTTKILVEVRDGIVQCIYSDNDDVEVTLPDWDNVKGNDDPNFWGWQSENNYTPDVLTEKYLWEQIGSANDIIKKNLENKIEQLR